MPRDLSIGTALELVGVALLAVALSTAHVLLGVAALGVLVVIIADEIRGAA